MQRRRSIPNGNTKNWPSSSTFGRRHKTWSFHVVVLQRTAKKGTKICNARAQPLSCSLKPLFNDVLVVVVVVVCLSSLFRSLRNHDGTERQRHELMSSTMAVHVRYNSWYISLPSSAKQQREMTKFCVIWRT